ncbi:MAG TPA: hypothetical protein VL346_00085, partial [Acidobacteriaceae bacterium]|nr:hypothetical protein [Acidobacteriaceae bacterium]
MTNDFAKDGQSADGLAAALRADLRRNLEQVEEQIAAACQTAGRSRDSVELMAVSKTHPAAAIEEIFRLGLSLFGENKVQEFAAKSAELSTLDDSGKTIR